MSDGVSTATKPPRRQRADTVLAVLAVSLVLAVVLSAAYLGYSIYAARAIERAATPATRATDDLYAQVRDEPNSAALRVRLAEALASAGRYREAVRELESALEIEPEHTGAYLVLGIIAMMQEQYDAAEGHFSKVVELTAGVGFEGVNQRRELAFFYLGEATFATGRYEEAVGYFKEALRIRRDNSVTYFNLAMALKALGEEDGALENLENALAFDPAYAQAHYEMGQIYLSRDDRVNAAVHFVKAVEFAPDQEQPAEALASLGSAEEWAETARGALSDGDSDRAIEAILIARVLDEENVDHVRYHARMLEQLGEVSGAVDVYRELLGLVPDDEDAAEALARLGAE